MYYNIYESIDICKLYCRAKLFIFITYAFCMLQKSENFATSFAIYVLFIYVLFDLIYAKI